MGENPKRAFAEKVRRRIKVIDTMERRIQVIQMSNKM